MGAVYWLNFQDIGQNGIILAKLTIYWPKQKAAGNPAAFFHTR
jgi:hypothetical protein